MKERGPTSFVVTLLEMPGWDAPAHQRLAKFLKFARRSYGLRCGALAESPAAGQPSDEAGDVEAGKETTTAAE